MVSREQIEALKSAMGTTGTPRTIKGRADRWFKAQGIKRSPYGEANSKTGTWGTYRKVGLTCPSSCPMLGNGCYAQKGRVALSQARASADLVADLWAFVAAALGSQITGLPLRLHVSGDFLTNDSLDLDYVENLRAILDAIGPVVAWTYTHAADPNDVETLRGALGPYGVAIRHSDVDTFVVSEWAEAPKRTIKCPNQRSNGAVTCVECMLCLRLDRTVTFRAH